VPVENNGFNYGLFVHMSPLCPLRIKKENLQVYVKYAGKADTKPRNKAQNDSGGRFKSMEWTPEAVFD